MDGDITYLPYQPPFADLEHAQARDGGTPGSSNFVNGYPYDLIDEVPVSSFKPVTTSLAKGGAVHYNGVRTRGSYPTIDRAYYYRVDNSEVITQSYWGANIDVYFQTLVKSNEASIWGYGPNGNANFTAKVDRDHAILKAWNSNTWININTKDLPDPLHKEAKFNKIFDGSMIERYVLCTDANQSLIACDDLGDPRVKDIYAKNLYSDQNCTNNSDTYLSLENSLLQIKEGASAARVQVDNKGLSIEDGRDTTYISASDTRITDGTDNSHLSAKGLWVDWGSSLTKVLGGSIEIKGSGFCIIEPPGGTNCSFKEICYVDGSLGFSSAYFLTSAENIPPCGPETITELIDRKIKEALQKLGVEASCDEDGNITVTLTGIPD